MRFFFSSERVRMVSIGISTMRIIISSPNIASSCVVPWLSELFVKLTAEQA